MSTATIEHTDQGINFRNPLFPGQYKFFGLPQRHTAMVGGLGSGKTHVGALKAFAMLAEGDGLIVAPTYRMLYSLSVAKLVEMFEDLGLRPEVNRSAGELRFRGRTIYLRSGTEPDRIRGPNVTWAWLDEAAMMGEQVWKIVLGRLRIPGEITGQTKTFLTTTPAGFNWVYTRFGAGDREEYGMVRVSTRENTFLADSYVADMEEDYSAEFAAQEIEGEFVAFEGLIYSEFKADVHILPDTFEIPKEWTRYRGIDYGYTNPFVCLWVAKDPDGRLYFYDEHYQRRKLLEYHAEEIKKRDSDTESTNKVRYLQTVADHAAQENAEIQALGVKTTKARKDVSTGIQKVKSRLKIQKDGRPRMYFLSNLTETTKEFYAYRWSDKSTKEEPMKESDHAMDVVRYITNAVDGPKIGARAI